MPLQIHRFGHEKTLGREQYSTVQQYDLDSGPGANMYQAQRLLACARLLLSHADTALALLEVEQTCMPAKCTPRPTSPRVATQPPVETPSRHIESCIL